MLLLLTGQLVGTVVMPMWELVRKGRIRELKDTENLRMPPIVSLDTLSLYSSWFSYEDAVVSTGQLTQLSFRDVKCNVNCHTKAHHRHENPQWALTSRRCGTHGREGTRNLSKPWQKQKLSPKNCSAEQVELSCQRSAMPLPGLLSAMSPDSKARTSSHHLASLDSASYLYCFSFFVETSKKGCCWLHVTVYKRTQQLFILGSTVGMLIHLSLFWSKIII